MSLNRNGLTRDLVRLQEGTQMKCDLINTRLVVAPTVGVYERLKQSDHVIFTGRQPLSNLGLFGHAQCSLRQSGPCRLGPDRRHHPNHHP